MGAQKLSLSLSLCILLYFRNNKTPNISVWYWVLRNHCVRFTDTVVLAYVNAKNLAQSKMNTKRMDYAMVE